METSQQQQNYQKSLSPIHLSNTNTNRACDKVHRGNGFMANEFLSDDDNSDKNMANNESINHNLSQMSNSPLFKQKHQQQQQQQRQPQQQQ